MLQQYNSNLESKTQIDAEAKKKKVIDQIYKKPSKNNIPRNKRIQREEDRKGFRLDSSVTIISHRLMNEYGEYEETNDNQKSKGSKSTSDNTLKSSINVLNKNIESATLEDIHILFVKFYHQSRKAEKPDLESTDNEKAFHHRQSQDNIVYYDEEDIL